MPAGDLSRPSLGANLASFKMGTAGSAQCLSGLRVELTTYLHPVPSRYKLPGTGCPEGGPGIDYVAFVLAFLGSTIICALCQLTISDQAEVTLQLTVFLN